MITEAFWRNQKYKIEVVSDFTYSNFIGFEGDNPVVIFMSDGQIAYVLFYLGHMLYHSRC